MVGEDLNKLDECHNFYGSYVHGGKLNIQIYLSITFRLLIRQKYSNEVI